MTAPAADDQLHKIIIELMGVPTVEANCQALVNTTALAVAGKGDAEQRAWFLDWFRKEAFADFSKEDALRGKDLAPLVNLLAERLTNRIAEIEAAGAGRA